MQKVKYFHLFTFAYTIPFQEDIFVRANFSKRHYKKKGGYPWVHKQLNHQSEFTTFY